jgi:hypothetical protein
LTPLIAVPLEVENTALTDGDPNVPPMRWIQMMALVAFSKTP